MSLAFEILFRQHHPLSCPGAKSIWELGLGFEKANFLIVWILGVGEINRLIVGVWGLRNQFSGSVIVFLGIQKSNRLIDCWVNFCFIMENMSRNGVYFGTMTMVLLSICGPARGQDSSGTNDCITALVPCSNYLNATKPPSSCCSPLMTEFATNKPCLCNLLNSSDLIQQFNVNSSEALELPNKCGLNAHTSGCSKLGGNSTSSGSTPLPQANTSSSASSKKGAVFSQTFSEILPLLALLLHGLAGQVNR